MFIKQNNLYKLNDISDTHMSNSNWANYQNSSFSKKDWIRIAYGIKGANKTILPSEDQIISIKSRMVTSNNYDYFIKFVSSYKNQYEFGLIDKLKDLFEYKQIDVSEFEINSLILHELENQDFHDFNKDFNVGIRSIEGFIKVFIDKFEDYSFNNLFFIRFLKEKNLINDLSDDELLELIQELRKENDLLNFEKEMFGEIESDNKESFSKTEADKYLSRANILFEVNNNQKALEYYDVALELNPTSYVAWNNKGLVLHNLGFSQQSLACFNKALELNPKYDEAWGNLGIVFFDTGQNREAVNCYNMASKLNTSPNSLKVMSKSLKMLGKSSKAIINYQEFANQAASDPSSLIESFDPGVISEADPSSLLDSLSFLGE